MTVKEHLVEDIRNMGKNEFITLICRGEGEIVIPDEHDILSDITNNYDPQLRGELIIDGWFILPKL